MKSLAALAHQSSVSSSHLVFYTSIDPLSKNHIAAQIYLYTWHRNNYSPSHVSIVGVPTIPHHSIGLAREKHHFSSLTNRQNAHLKRVFDIQLSDNLSTQLLPAFTASPGVLRTRRDP